MNELYKCVSNGMREIVPLSTLAILFERNSKLEQHGTGTLIRFADHWLLVTASHVVEQYMEARDRGFEGPLYVSPSPAGGNLIQLVGRPFYTPRKHPSSSRLDIYDLAFCELDREMVNALSERTFLNRADTNLQADVSSGVFYVSGFPKAWSTTAQANADTLVQRAFQLTTHAHEGTPSSGITYSAKHHILLDCDKRNLFDLNGNCVAIPELQGISGCGIWRVCDDSQDPLTWDVKQAKLVGVQTRVIEYRDDSRTLRHVICGTRLMGVVAMLVKEFPDLKKSFGSCFSLYKEAWQAD